MATAAAMSIFTLTIRSHIMNRYSLVQFSVALCLVCCLCAFDCNGPAPTPAPVPVAPKVASRLLISRHWMPITLPNIGSSLALKTRMASDGSWTFTMEGYSDHPIKLIEVEDPTKLDPDPSKVDPGLVRGPNDSIAITRANYAYVVPIYQDGPTWKYFPLNPDLISLVESAANPAPGRSTAATLLYTPTDTPNGAVQITMVAGFGLETESK